MTYVKYCLIVLGTLSVKTVQYLQLFDLKTLHIVRTVKYEFLQFLVHLFWHMSCTHDLLTRWMIY